MEVNIDRLKPSVFSSGIYDHTPPEDLIESIKMNGVIQPIWITEDNIIISGHRRVNACRILGIKEIKAEVMPYSDLIVVEANRYRQKTWTERLREARALEEILRPKALEREKAGKKIDPHPNLDEGWTLSQVAKAIGTSHGTLHKVKTIAKEEPELMKDLDSGKITVHSAFKKVEREKHIKNHKEVPLPNGKYNIIYADPPWEYWGGGYKGPSQHYKTMSIKEICNLPVQDIAADNCILFMWATFPILPQALKVIEAWGFKYSTVGFVWVKANKSGRGFFFGLGSWTRANAEVCFIATKGTIPRKDASISQIIYSPVEEHSKKPDITREKIVQLVGYLPRIEIFARQKVKGWDAWGNEL